MVCQQCLKRQEAETTMMIYFQCIVKLSFSFTGWNHAVTLALPVRHLSLVINDDITGLPYSLRTNNSLYGHNFADERFLCLEKLHWDILLLPVGICFKIILRLAGSFGKDSAVVE